MQITNSNDFYALKKGNALIKKQMDDVEKAKVENTVNNFNKKLANGKLENTKELGKDDFLKILITQLKNQDPLKPMEDKEFIAQMAQLSTLEQIKNLSSGFDSMSAEINSSNALSLIGKNVEINQKGTRVKGLISEVLNGKTPQIKINDKFYDYFFCNKSFKFSRNKK